MINELLTKVWKDERMKGWKDERMKLLTDARKSLSKGC